MHVWACLRVKPPFWKSDYLDAYAPLHLKEGIQYRRKNHFARKRILKPNWSACLVNRSVLCHRFHEMSKTQYLFFNNSFQYGFSHVNSQWMKRFETDTGSIFSQRTRTRVSFPRKSFSPSQNKCAKQKKVCAEMIPSWPKWVTLPISPMKRHFPKPKIPLWFDIEVACYNKGSEKWHREGILASILRDYWRKQHQNRWVRLRRLAPCWMPERQQHFRVVIALKYLICSE